MQHNMWVCTYQLYVTTCVSEKGLFYQKYSQQSGVQKLYHALRSKLSTHHCQQQRLPMCVSCVSFSQLPRIELRSNREFSTCSKMGGEFWDFDIDVVCRQQKIGFNKLIVVIIYLHFFIKEFNFLKLSPSLDGSSSCRRGRSCPSSMMLLRRNRGEQTRFLF